MTISKPRKYSGEDIIEALEGLGIMVGDIVYFSTGFGFLGKAEGVQSSSDLNKLFYESIRKVLGPEGTILVPTYSYTFGRSLASELAIFDPLETKSETGPFPEFFRQQGGVSRSLDPMVSISGIGPEFASLIRDLPPTSYGTGCVFDRLTKMNAKICNIGLGSNWVPFLHHADWLAKVSYRYDKQFFGKIVDGDKLYQQAWVYAVPVSRTDTASHGYRLGDMAEKAGVWAWASLGRGRVYAASYKELFDFTVENLNKDPWLTANFPNPENKPHSKKSSTLQSLLAEEKNDFSVKAGLLSLFPLSRYVVSDGMDEAFNLISKWVSIKVHEYPTGMSCLDWIIPEKWHCNEASLKTIDGEIVFSSKTEPFHSMPYSLPFEGEVPRSKLIDHLHVSNLIPQAIPTKQHIVSRDWGLCCSKETRDSLKEDRYRVIIDSSFTRGGMKVGEVVALGLSEKTIILCAYLDGPGQANETLSGALVGLNVMINTLHKMKIKYTYRLLILPGPGGFAGWLSQNEKLIIDIKGVLILSGLGSQHPHNLQLSGKGETVFEKVCKNVMRKKEPNSQLTAPGKFFEALPSGGNPLSVNNKRDFNFPILTLYRSLPDNDLYYPCYGYQTNLDNIDGVSLDAMADSGGLVSSIIDELDGTV